MLYAYASDFTKLSAHGDYPSVDSLRSVTKQGATDAAPSDGFASSTEGSQLIVDAAKVSDSRPIYVLVWGSITDVAQAVHDDPSIKDKIRVYSIGAWNTIMDKSARRYLYDDHADMWWIENDTTFYGMYESGCGNHGDDLSNNQFVEQHVVGHGALGDLFYDKKHDLKMGDTPSVLYMLNGDIDDPEGESWGGQFRATDHGANYWTDRTDEACHGWEGASTVGNWREQFLRDWQSRMDRLQ